ncbi:MAG: hypothetical protein JW395_3839 [Nitrospira sp.]|nr:hypothetical protein [Nitrospira sp.]
MSQAVGRSQLYVRCVFTRFPGKSTSHDIAPSGGSTLRLIARHSPSHSATVYVVLGNSVSGSTSSKAPLPRRGCRNTRTSYASGGWASVATHPIRGGVSCRFKPSQSSGTGPGMCCLICSAEMFGTSHVPMQIASLSSTYGSVSDCPKTLNESRLLAASEQFRRNP